MICRGCASQLLLPSPPPWNRGCAVSVTRDPDGSSLAVPASSCSTGTEGGDPGVPKLGEGERTPTCLSFGCCRTHLLFRHHSIIPCNSTRLLGGNPAWDCVSIARGWAGLLCPALEQLAPARHCGGWGNAGTSRSSALSLGVRGTQTCVKEKLEKGASTPGPSRAFLSLLLFILLLLHKRRFCGAQRDAIGSSHGREDDDRGGSIPKTLWCFPPLAFAFRASAILLRCCSSPC